MTDGWRCTDCGTIVVEDCQGSDELAIEIAAERGEPVAESSGRGCPLCPYMTRVEPVSVQVYKRDVHASARARMRPVPIPARHTW